MYTLYPSIKANNKYEIPVTEPHKLYVEESGEPDGLPVLVIHGGPGAGSDPQLRRYFDPEIYRIILFDQRGAGLSNPHAELTNNTTADLINDIEIIREHLGVDNWIVFGGSWGSTLALTYAQAHPENVMGLILRGIFLGRPEDVAWFYEIGPRYFFPDYWQEFLNLIPEAEQDNLLKAYYERLTGEDDLLRMAAAKSWSTLEARCATLIPDLKLIEHCSDPFVAHSIASIECHYFINNCFLEPNQILENMHKIKHIPGIIIHGRYDMICPLENAWELHHAWEGSELKIVRNAGHAACEPAIIDALVHATQEMSKIFYK